MKKLVLVFISVVTILILGSVVYFNSKNASVTTNSPIADFIVHPTPTPELRTWNDQAGFRFEYPTILSINSHDEDAENYAHIELTNSEHPGSIIIWAKDTQYTDVSEWIKKDARLSSGVTADTIFAKQQGKKILFTEPVQERVVGTISEQILFSIEGKLTDTSFWTPIFENISSSFIFISPQSETPNESSNTSKSNEAQVDSGGNNSPIDEEEVLE